MNDVRVPWRRSLFFRLFGLGTLIALVAVAAATWATVRATTVAVREAQQDSLHADARIYDALVGYAATHAAWAGAEALVDELAREADRQVSVTDLRGRVLVDSARQPGRRPVARARARLDALDVDPVLVSELGSAAPAELVPGPVSEPVDGPCAGDCRVWTVDPPGLLDGRVDPDAGAADGRVDPRVERRLARCLARAGLPPPVGVTRNLGVLVDFRRGHVSVERCAGEARRVAYRGEVAPPALLFVHGEEGSAEVFWDLSRDSQTRIVLLAGGVLLVTSLLCLLLAGSVVRPLRRMAVAAERAGDGDLSVRVSDRRGDEVGAVARAFNRMADRRQQLEEARRRLVSDVSHELRTPIANIRGWLEAAQDGLADPGPPLLDSLHEETLHLQRLVDDLHELALGDAGELRLEPVEIDLGVLLDQVAASFRGQADAVGVVVDAVSEPGAVVLADAVRLRQAVGNLVTNALRHTPAGGSVRLRGRTGTIEVTDTGEGIPATELPHVFERFRRVDTARGRSTGGSGLGLAIVRQIVEAHGGSAEIESRPGEGTTVRLRLPHA
ncbi:sensor histidine kinase [Nocardioides ferulae]|uniref:sensor histidine kinase n=1 Tax=Nocardioides ferulae TaxID=2340821 RepID=UPI000EAE9FD5|nr:HAMP domain-containing sensor histidine kinase [Nocardioides ferulae]